MLKSIALNVNETVRQLNVCKLIAIFERKIADRRKVVGENYCFYENESFHRSRQLIAVGKAFVDGYEAKQEHDGMVNHHDQHK